LVPEEELRQKGAEIFRVGRGGETTFHGPGQLVAYPVVNLRRLKKGARAYVEALEDTVVKTLQKFCIKAQVQTLFPSHPTPPGQRLNLQQDNQTVVKTLEKCCIKAQVQTLFPSHHTPPGQPPG
jgi:hypothetical protein